MARWVLSAGTYLPDSLASESCSTPEALIRTRWSKVLTCRSRTALLWYHSVSMGRDKVCNLEKADKQLRISSSSQTG